MGLTESFRTVQGGPASTAAAAGGDRRRRRAPSTDSALTGFALKALASLFTMMSLLTHEDLIVTVSNGVAEDGYDGVSLNLGGFELVNRAGHVGTADASLDGHMNSLHRFNLHIPGNYIARAVDFQGRSNWTVAAGDGGQPAPTPGSGDTRSVVMHQLQAACPAEVAACEADPGCSGAGLAHAFDVDPSVHCPGCLVDRPASTASEGASKVQPGVAAIAACVLGLWPRCVAEQVRECSRPNPGGLLGCLCRRELNATACSANHANRTAKLLRQVRTCQIEQGYL